MNTYKFRAECLLDVMRLMEKVPLKVIKIENGLYPDCTAEITTDMSIDGIKTLMRSIPDSHVMLETIMPLNEYSGIRKINSYRAP